MGGTTLLLPSESKTAVEEEVLLLLVVVVTLVSPLALFAAALLFSYLLRGLDFVLRDVDDDDVVVVVEVEAALGGGDVDTRLRENVSVMLLLLRERCTRLMKGSSGCCSFVSPRRVAGFVTSNKRVLAPCGVWDDLKGMARTVWV